MLLLVTELRSSLFVSWYQSTYHPLFRFNFSLCTRKVNDDGHLDFAEFIGCVHVMSPLCTANEKASAMFRIYDVSNSSIISRDDLKYILGCVTHRPRSKAELTLGVNVEETLEEHMEKEREWDHFIESIVNEIMTVSSSDPDDEYMTFEDFMQSLATTQADFREKMNIPFSIHG